MPFSMRTLVECVQKKLTSAANSLLRRSMARRALLREVQQELFWGQPLDFRRLETRRVLNASFALAAGDVNLSAFTAGTNLTVSHEIATNEYVFRIDSGIWVGDGDNELRVADAALSGNLDIDSGVNSNVTFDGNIRPISSISIKTLGNISNNAGTDLTVTGNFVVSGSGSIDLGGKAADDFNFGTVNFNSTGNVLITEQSEMAVVGANTAQDVKLTTVSAVSDLAINGNLTATGDVVLVVGRDLTQTGAISAVGLGVDVDRITTLDNANNDVDTFAANNIDRTIFTDIDDVAVGSVTVAGKNVTGITTASDNNVRLNVGGDLAIDQAVSIGAGNLLLDVTGNLTQTASITAGGLGLMVDGTTTLTDAGNNIATLAAENGGETVYSDLNAFNVGSVTVGGTTLNGITTTNDDVKLTEIGDFNIAQAVALGSGDLLLNVTGNVTQSAAITASGLGLMVTGTTTLNNPANNVVTIAANNGGETQYTDADTLAVGAVTVAGMTVTGITTTNDDVKLTVNIGNLDINQAVALGTGDLLLDVTGNVAQTATITASGLALMVDGTTTLTAANNVATIAANNGGETVYTDANILAVGSVTVAGMTVTGITTTNDDVKLTEIGDFNIAQEVALGSGDLLLNVTGNVTQSAAITASGLGLMVSGTTTLNNSANNVVTIAADNGGETQYTDADTLIVGAVTVAGMTVTGITTTNDDVKLTVNVGNLDINQAVALGTGDLLLDVTGNVAQTATITATGLALMVDGSTTLNAANNVATIAANNGGETVYTDANILAVGAVTVAGMTVTGITSTNDDVKLTVDIGNLDINQAIALGAGDLLLDVTGDVTQTAAITANGLALMVDGTTTLTNAANNVTTIAASNGGETVYTDADTLAVGSVTVAGMTVNGITTTNDDVKLTVTLGNLDINQTIALGTGDLLLDVTGNVAQTAATTAGGLGLMVDGTTTLNNAANNVTTIAANNGGETQYTDANTLTVGAVTVAGMTVTGIATTDDDVKLTVNIGNLDINQAVALGAGDLLLDVTGNVAQTATITASGLALMVDGTTTLTAANNVATIAANNGGETVYTDANILAVGSVTVAGMTVTGITTTNDDVKLTVDIGNLDINQAVALGTGDLLLDVTGNVAQTAAITAGGLGLIVDGTTTLNNAANNVATIALNNGGETQYTDANSLAVGAVTVAGMTVTGITTTNDDVKLTVDIGNLDINQLVALGAGDLLLDVTGNVAQTAAITAAGLGLMVDGTTTLTNAANNVANIAANNGGETVYTDANILTVGSVTVAGMTITGVTTTNDDVKLTVDNGNLDITDALALGAGDLLLDVTGDVTQTAAITANGLALMVDGTTILNNAANNVATIAANNGGETQYTDANALAVGTVIVAGMTVTGITTTNDDVKLTVSIGNLGINQAVALGTGDLFLDVTGNVTQAAAITAGGLGLMVDGTTTLTNAANNVATIAANNGGETLYTDANTVAVGTVTVAGMTVIGITTTNDDVKLTVDIGNLDINQAIALGTGDLFLDVTGNVAQTASITASGLGLMVDGSTILNDLGNNVVTLAAANGGVIVYRNVGDLNIGAVTVAGMTVDDVVTPGDITITARSIIDADVVDAVPIDFDIDGANVTLTATLGSIGSSTGDPLCDGVFNLLEVRATGNLIASAPNGLVALDSSVLGTTTISALSGVLQSDGDVDATGLDVSLTTNLYLIADADRNGTGTLTIDSPLSVAGDLRLQGADIISVGALVLRADRILFVSGTNESISVSDSLLNAVPLVLDARAGGNLTVTATGDIRLQDLDCDNVALSSTTIGGNVTLTSTGSVTVLDDVIAGFDGAATTSTGTIQISASVDLLVHDAIVSDSGNIVLHADNDVRITVAPVPELDDLVVVTTATGTIEISADFNNDSNGAGGELFMSDQARVIAGRGNLDYIPGLDGNPSPTAIALSSTAIAGATVTMSADENITVGSVQSADNTGSAIQATSRNGGIVDGGDTDPDFVANFTGALATLRSVTGTGNGNALETLLYSVDATNAAGTVIATSGDICINEVAAGTDLRVVSANNSAGAVQIQVDAGSLNILGLGVTTATGNILLKASQDVKIDAAVIATNGGHITLDAGDDVDVNALIQTDVNGDIYIEARNSAIDPAGPEVDGINIDAVVSANNGSILLRSNQDIRTTADIDSLRVGLTANRNVLQNSTIQATSSDLAVVATLGSFTMSAGSSILAINNIVATAGGSISLGFLNAANVGLSAGGSISDANGAGITNVLANNLSMRAGVAIGTAVLPIDTSVTQLAATTPTSSAGIFINEADTLVVGNVPALSALVIGVNRVNFKAAASNESLSAVVTPVSGISTNNGNAKLIVNAGNLDINQAITLGSGNLFLDVAGNVAQNALGIITAGGLGLMVDGTTTLQNVANNVATIAADNIGQTLYTDADTLSVGSVTVGTMTVTGMKTNNADVKLTVLLGNLDINQAVTLGAGDLFLDVTGNVAQSAAGIITANGLGLMVDGTTTLQNVANNVATIAADNGGETLYTDADTLEVGTVTVNGMSVTGIKTTDDDVKLTVLLGNLDINQAVTLGAGDLFLDVTGTVSQSLAGIITAGGMGLMVDGTTTLQNVANNVVTIAADNKGETLYIDADTLAVGTVTVNGMTVTGITTTNDDVKLTVLLGNLGINQAVALGTGNLFLDVTGNVAQTAAGSITANGLGLMVDGTTTLQNATNNVVTIAADNGGETLYSDANTLVVGVVTVSGMTVTGVKTSNDDVKLAVLLGNLDINQAVTLGAGDLLLDVTGNVAQSAAGIITASGLGLMVDGTTTLQNPANNVSIIAADNGGETLYVDVDTLEIGSVTVGSMTVTGFKTSNDDVKLTVNAGNLNINQAVALGTGDLFLDVTGNVTQSVAGAITASGLGLMVDGTTTLQNGINNLTTIAADNGGETLYTDADTLVVGTVTVNGMTVTGIKTSDDDVKLTVLLGNLAINQAITLGAGDLFLDITGNVNQAAAGTITASGLGLMVDGLTTLQNVANNVITIAADNGGETLYTDADTLTVGIVTVNGMTVTGVKTSDDDVKLTVLLGNLDINQAVALGAGDLLLDVTGNVAQAAAGVITANGLGLMVDGTTTLQNVANNVVTIAADNGGETLYTDANTLEVGIVTVNGMTVTGIKTSDDDVKLTVLLGNLDINRAVTLGTGDLFLDVTGNVAQAAAGIITASGLGLMVDGTTTLQNVANNVATIAADNGGETLYTDADTLEVSIVTVNGMTVTGIKTTDDDVKLTVLVSNLDINQAITLGAGDLFLDVTGNVAQAAAGIITVSGLGLMVDGTTTLQNVANNVVTLAADNGGETLYTDANTLAVGTVTVDGMTVTGIKTTNDNVKLTVLLGNLDINQAVILGAGNLFLDVTGNVAQAAAGVITASGLGLMVDGTTTLQNVANNVATIAADNGGETLYTDANTLAVGAINVDGMTVTGIRTSDDDVKLTVLPGNLNITEAVTLGAGDLFLDVRGNVAQTATGVITVSGLGLMVAGTTTLQNISNNVVTIAADNGGETLYTDVDTLTVGTVTVNGMTVTGITTSDDDVKLTVLLGNVDINQAVALGAGDLLLDVTGNVAQAAAGVIAANGLGLMVDGTTSLQNVANNVVTIAADNGGETIYTDADTLVVGIVTVNGMTVTGIKTSDDDVKLTVLVGNLDINQAITLGTGDLFLDVTGNVAQAAAGIITASGLGLMVDGTTTLQNVANNVVTIAADNGGETLYTDANTLEVGIVTVNGMTVTGIRTTDDDVKLTVLVGNLDINQAITLGAGDLFLDVTGNVAQSLAGIITASGLGLMVDGTTTLQNVANNVVTIAADNGGETLYIDSNTLAVGIVTVDGMTVTGIKTTDDNVKLTVLLGNLDINQAITLGAGNLFLDVTGNVAQTVAGVITASGLGLMVDGTTTLQNVANNVTTIAADNGGETLYTDADTLEVGTVTVDGMTVTGIKTSDDDVKLTVLLGNLDINQAVTLGAGDLLLDVTGNVAQSAAGIITASGLGLMVDGTTTLQNPANNVAIIAADNGGETLYVDADTLEIGSVTVNGMTVTGFKTSNDDVKLTVNAGNLNINQEIALGTGDLFLDVTGNVTQSAVGVITAGGLGLMVDGTTTLQNAANDVTTIAADNGGETLYTDSSTLTVGTVTVNGMTVTGIKTSDDDVKLTVLLGNLAINQAVTLGAGDLFLDVTGNVTQNATGFITASGLGLMVDGLTTLQNAANNVTTVAADNGGETLYTDADTLTVGIVTVNGMTVTGIKTSDDDVKLTVLLGNLDINQAVALGGGDLLLDVTGNVAQSAAGIITANGLGLMVDGTTTLQNVANNVVTIAADNGGETLYTDADTLEVGIVTVNGMTVTGIKTTDDDVKLTVLLGNLDINQAITLGAGDLFLDVTGNVAQAAAGIITASGLGLMVDGTTTLQNVANNVATIAADNGGETLYTDASTLEVGIVTVNGMSVTGIKTTDDDVKLTVLLGNLDINQAITLGAGDLFLDVTGNVAQAAAGIITASGLGLMVDGTTTLQNVANNVVTIAADNGGETLYTEANTLAVGTVTVNGMTVTGIKTTNDNAKLTVLLGNLDINQAITLGAGNLFLDVTGNVAQAAAGVITASGLGLMVDGTTTLQNVANNVATIAADNGGQTLYTDANTLAVGAVTVNGMTVTGIKTSDDDVKLTVLLGNLNITEAVTLGAGDLFLDVTGNVAQTAAGFITASGLGLLVGGTTTLQNTANNVVTIAADNGGETLYTDADTLTVGTVTVDGMIVTGIKTTNDDVKLTVLLGNLAINQAITLGTGNLFLDVTGNVTQTAAGIITASGLGLMVDGTTTLQNVANNVVTIAADNGGESLYTDADTLEVGIVTVNGMTLTGIKSTDDDVKLTVLLGNLDINQAITLGSGDLFLDVTGNVVQAVAGVITSSGLGLMVDGTTTLQNVANNVVTIAADNGGETLYTDANTLTVGTVTVNGMTVTGIKTTDDDVKLTVLLGNLDINQAVTLGTGDLFLDVTGNVAQSPTGIITASGLGLMVDGTTTLQNVANNVATIAADNKGETLFTDANTLLVGTVTVDGMTVTGIKTTDDDVKLTVLLGNLEINEVITLGTGDLFLDVTGNVVQAAAGTITANGLGLMVDGTTTLQNVDNNVVTIAADNGGKTLYADANKLDVGVVTVDGMTVTGIKTNNADVKLRVLASDLAINQAVAIGTGNLFLDITGDVTQSSAGNIIASGLGLIVDGKTTLQNTNNDVSTIAAKNGGEIRYVDANTLTVGIVTVDDLTVPIADQTVTGITTTTNADVKLTVLVGDLAINQAVAVGTGDLFLAITGDVTQSAVGSITASGLGLIVNGKTTLENTGNNVTTLAARNGGEIRYVDANLLTVGIVTVNDLTVPPADTTVTGIVTNNAKVTLTANISDLIVNQTIKTGSGNVDLTAKTGHIDSLSGLGNSIAVIANQLTLKAGTYAHLRTQVNELTTVSVVRNGSLNDSFLNQVADDTGDNFLETLKTGIATSSTFADSQKNNFQYRARFGVDQENAIDDGNVALYISNDGNLVVKDVTAGDLSNPASVSPNVYIETTKQFNLAINGAVSTHSATESAGVLVLIAGGTMSQNGSIVTETTLLKNLTNSVILNSTFFKGGDGPSITSSEFVYGTYDATNTYATQPPESDGLDKSNDYYQRVVIQFGKPGETGFLSIIAYADGKISATKQFVTDSGAFVDREVLFENDFLANNPTLPTNAIIRRADSIFLFSNGGNNDLTFAAAPITNVKSQGTPGGGYVSPEPEIPSIQQYVAPIIAPPLATLTQPQLPEIELPAQLAKSTDVAIYQVDFEDDDENGQVEQSELPTYEIVLDKGLDEKDENATPIKAKEGKTPTQDDIDRAKNAMQNDPNQPAGAYAIIKKDAEGNKTVLDIFSIRDWPEKQAADTDDGDEIKVPKLEPFNPDSIKGSAKDPAESSTEGEVVPPPVAEPKDADTSLFVPAQESGSRQESRFASAGLLLGSLWMLHNSHTKSNQATLENSPQENASVDYSRQARRRRQRAK